MNAGRNLKTDPVASQSSLAPGKRPNVVSACCTRFPQPAARKLCRSSGPRANRNIPAAVTSGPGASWALHVTPVLEGAAPYAAQS